MTTTIANSNPLIVRPAQDSSHLQFRIIYLGYGAFHYVHQALYTHHLLEATDGDWNICEANLMPGNNCILIENLHKQQLLYAVAEKGADNIVLKVIGSVKEALHPELDGYGGILQTVACSQTAVVSLAVTEKSYRTDAASGQLDLSNPLVKHDPANPATLESVIDYIVQTLHLRREQGLAAFTVTSRDNVRKNRHVAEVAVLGLAQVCDLHLAQWTETNATFLCTMIDHIVPAVMPETLQGIVDQLGVYDPCIIACESPRQWVVEDNFVNGRPDWDRAGMQFVTDVVLFEMMKLRMSNGSHSFLAYLGYLGGYETIADAMTNPTHRKATFALTMQEQAPVLSMPEGTDLNAYTTLLIERFSSPSLHHRIQQVAMDSSQKLPQHLLDPVCLHPQNDSDWRYLVLNVAGQIYYIYDVNKQRQVIDVVGLVQAELQHIN